MPPPGRESPPPARPLTQNPGNLDRAGICWDGWVLGEGLQLDAHPNKRPPRHDGPGERSAVYVWYGAEVTPLGADPPASMLKEKA